MKMCWSILMSKAFWFLLIVTLSGRGSCIPHPDFESGWLPIINGLEHVARLNVGHGLGEIPVLVDVSVSVNDYIFPASGFRPDHPVEKSGPVVYIYDTAFVNVSTSPNEDFLYRIVPPVPPRFYSGVNLELVGNARVRVRAWKQFSLPTEDYHKAGIQLKANTSKSSDSYAEISHNLDEVPCLVVVRMHMRHNDGVIVADGVGSSMQVFADVPDRTNAYLVYGYSNTTFRLWVDSSQYGAIFDGRKHTWFDFVISEGEGEIFAWRCSTLGPAYNKRIETRNNLDKLPRLTTLSAAFGLENALIKVSIKAEQPGGANEGFYFPAAMHLGYPAPSETGNTVTPISVGGLSYGYLKKEQIYFWRPKFNNYSSVFIAKSFGSGINSEFSNSESVYIQSWIYKENVGCVPPVIYHGFANTTVNGTSTGANAKARCDDGYVLESDDFFKPDVITCHKYGYWKNIPRCLPIAKDVDFPCNPAEDKCRDEHSVCTIDRDNSVYKCLCQKGFNSKNGRCIAMGEYLPKPDYDSDWKYLYRITSQNWFYQLEHGLGTVPQLVDVQVYVSGYTFQALGFRPDQRSWSFSSAVIYLYDEKFINVSSFLANRDHHNLVSVKNYQWSGYQYEWYHYGQIRARAWKAKSLPMPDIEDTTHVMRANTSKASDSFYEVTHNMEDYPGLVVVRAKMQHNGTTLYANGVGSALNVFYNTSEMTNSFLVFGYGKNSIRAWVDSSSNGVIFDGRKVTKFDFVISEATVEIFAWKVSTLTPFFTYMFSLEDYRLQNSLSFPVVFELQDSLNVAVAEITDPTANNTGFRFPSSSYMADRYMYESDVLDAHCVFGGFTYAYGERYSSWLSNREMEIKMLLYQPLEQSFRRGHTGALVCIPRSFGNGEYSEAAFGGVGILQSWYPADCGPAPSVDHGYINTTVNGTEVGSLAALECDEGYRLSNNREGNRPRCGVGVLGGIEWIVYVRCLPVECGAVEELTYGTVHAAGDTFGNKITFECDVGYKLEGEEEIDCLASGKWSAKTPVCKIVECGTVEAPLKGTMDATGETFGSTVTFKCEDGHKLDGDKVIKCLSSGKWSAAAPVCKDGETSSSDRLRLSEVLLCMILGFVFVAYDSVYK